MMPSSFSKVQRKVCCSVLYGALLAADRFAFKAPEAPFSSTKMSVTKLSITDGLTDAHLRDHTTTPDVVTISKVSNISTTEVVDEEKESNNEGVWYGKSMRIRCTWMSQKKTANLLG